MDWLLNSFVFYAELCSQEFVSGGVLMITSPSVGDGKTLTSLNLCACLADSGDATLFVEADVRRPTAGKLLGAGGATRN